MNWRDMKIFRDVDLEDCFVLGWREENDSLIFDLELSLWPGHEEFEIPQPGEYTCYKRGRLVFEQVKNIVGLRTMESAPRTVDPDGTIDFGCVDALSISNNGRVEVSGDFGNVVLNCGQSKLEINDSTGSD